MSILLGFFIGEGILKQSDITTVRLRLKNPSTKIFEIKIFFSSLKFVVPALQCLTDESSVENFSEELLVGTVTN